MKTLKSAPAVLRWATIHIKSYIYSEIVRGNLLHFLHKKGPVRGHFITLYPLKDHHRGQFIAMSPPKEHPRGQYNTFCPLEKIPTGHFIMFYLLWGYPRGHFVNIPHRFHRLKSGSIRRKLSGLWILHCCVITHKDFESFSKFDLNSALY